MSSFAFGSEYTVGIEEELLLVDPATHRLAPVAGDVLGAMQVDPSAASHEAYAAQLELRSPPSSGVGEAIDALADLRACASAAGAVLLGAGLHPAGAMGDAELVPESRYEHVADEMRGLLRRTPEAALHIHVGLPDEKAAISAFNAVRRTLPLLQALSASSPWWFGVDSGLASSRFALTRSYPGRGVPAALTDFGELESLVARTLAAAGTDEPTFLWWDIRLHPRYGTIEVRELDAQASLEDVAALAALVRAVVVESQTAPAGRDDPSEVIGWSSFRAARDGIAATLLDGDALRPVPEIAHATVARLRPFARELGDEDALDGVERLVREGGGAARQRAAFTRGGMAELLRMLVDSTMAASRRERSAAQQWVDARAARDLERLAALTAEDATWTSPVDGRSVGRDEVVAHVEAGFAETDFFATELLSYEQRGSRAVAVVRNVAARDGDRLDSRQALVLDETDGMVSSVRIEVDDPDAVERFWED